MTSWHNEYRNGAWRYSWPPGKPLPYGVGFYATPGNIVLSSQKETFRLADLWPRRREA